MFQRIDGTVLPFAQRLLGVTQAPASHDDTWAGLLTTAASLAPRTDLR